MIALVQWSQVCDYPVGVAETEAHDEVVEWLDELSPSEWRIILLSDRHSPGCNCA